MSATTPPPIPVLLRLPSPPLGRLPTAITPDVQGALYYSHTSVIIEAIKNADSFKPADIRDAIAKLNGFETIVGTVYADKYTNLIYEIGIAKIVDGVPTMSGSVSMASDYGFGA